MHSDRKRTLVHMYRHVLLLSNTNTNKHYSDLIFLYSRWCESLSLCVIVKVKLSSRVCVRVPACVCALSLISSLDCLPFHFPRI